MISISQTSQFLNLSKSPLMKRFSRILLFTLLCSVSLSAQETFSLEGAINYALEHSSEIKNGQLDIADADAQILENKAIGFPQLNGGLDYTNNVKIPSSVATVGSFPSDGMMAPPNPDSLIKITFGTTHGFNTSLDLNWRAVDPS